MKAGKVWGETECIFSSDNVSVHRIKINAKGYCSKHKHTKKSNQFFVESGRVIIKQWTGQDSYDDTTLHAGDSLVVAEGVAHRFIALEDAVVYEIYTTSLNPEDIVRVDIGGSDYGQTFPNGE